MSLRTKTILVLLATVTCLLLAFYLIGRFEISSYTREYLDVVATEKASEVRNTLKNSIETVKHVAKVFATRPDVSNFFADPSSANFPPADLPKQLLDVYGLHFVMLLDKQGRSIYEWAYDFNKEKEVKFPNRLNYYVFNPDGLLATYSIHDDMGGFLMCELGPVRFAFIPIFDFKKAEHHLTNDDINGYIFVGEEVFHHKITPFGLFFPSDYGIAYSAGRDGIASSCRDYEEMLKGAEFTHYYENSDEGKCMKIVMSVYDAFQNKCFYVHLKINDYTVFRNGVLILYMFMQCLAGLAIGFVLLLILDKLVLNRLSNLKQQMSRLGGSGDLSERVSYDGRDEISSVSKAANRMLDDIEVTVAAKMEAERQLFATQQRLATVVNGVSDMVYYFPKEGAPEFFNDTCEQITGYKKDEFVANPNLILEILHPDDKDMFSGLHMCYTADKASMNLDYRIVSKDGEVKWLYSLRVPSFGPGNGIVGFNVIDRDITERKHAEETIRASEEQHRKLFESSPDGIAISDLDGRVENANDALVDMLGYNLNDLRKKTLKQITPEKWHSNIDDAMKKIQAGEKYVFYEKEILKKNGELLPVGVTVWFYLDAACNPTKIGTFIKDLTLIKKAETERLELEEQMRHSQKLESLGVLAGGIAHDFNNLLTGIIGNANLAATKLHPASPVVNHIVNIETTASRAAELCKQMLAYSGKGKFEIKAIDLNATVRDITQLLSVSISKKAQIRYNFTSGYMMVDADVSQMRQVLMNLITNASEALGENTGLITIATGINNCDEEYLNRYFAKENLKPGQYVFLSVTDTGCGMDSETMNKIFDPFFSTKFTGRGLGLAAVLGIIKGHKGAIRVYSELGKGTTFKILLPKSNVQAPEIEAVVVDNTKWTASGTVLVADDDPFVREVVVTMFEDLGFTVITASDGAVAVEKFRRNASSINLVMLDLTMPKMSGDEVFHEIKRVNPGVNVILTSGYNEQESVRAFAGKGLAGFIQKPFQFNELRAKIRAVVDK